MKFTLETGEEYLKTTLETSVKSIISAEFGLLQRVNGKLKYRVLSSEEVTALLTNCSRETAEMEI